MPSSLSERRVLHMVNASPFASDALVRALALLAPSDALLLVGDAVVAAVRCAAERLPDRVDRCYALAADLAARGYSATDVADGVEAIDDLRWVELVTAHDTCVTWSR